MVNAHDTQKILECFFNDCYKYWLRNGYEERESFELALNDIRAVKRNPFVPCGDELDLEVKEKFIHYKEMDLGGK